MTAASLAESLGISPATVSHYEHERSAPSPPVFAGICKTLCVPEAHLLRPALKSEDAPYLYRSLAAATKKARESAEVRHRWLLEVVSFLDSHIEFPEPNVPDMSGGRGPEALTEEDIEAAATAVRREWGMGDGPISHVVGLLEAQGVMVARFAFNASKLDAFSKREGVRPYVIMNADGGSAVRCRFDVAHELGHLVLHGPVSKREAAAPALHKLMESQAHRFAGAFLFPAGAFADEVFSVSLHSLVPLKRRWGVSIQMMVRRAYDLGLVSRSQYERAFRDISRRGYRKSEPLDDEIEPESPTLLADAVRMLLEHGLVTRGDLLVELPFLPRDVEVLCSLPAGYLLHDDWGAVARLKPRPNASDEGDSEGANVLPFDRNRG